LFQKGLLRARAGLKMRFGSSPAGRQRVVGEEKKHNRLFSFLSMRARVEQKMRLLWLQPGGEKHSRLSSFSFIARAQDPGQKNALWFQPGVGERSTTRAACSHFLSLRTARAQDRKMRFGSSREWGNKAMFFDSFVVRVQ